MCCRGKPVRAKPVGRTQPAYLSTLLNHFSSRGYILSHPVNSILMKRKAKFIFLSFFFCSGFNSVILQLPRLNDRTLFTSLFPVHQSSKYGRCFQQSVFFDSRWLGTFVYITLDISALLSGETSYSHRGEVKCIPGSVLTLNRISQRIT